jgi:hypothetical protein
LLEQEAEERCDQWHRLGWFFKQLRKSFESTAGQILEVKPVSYE